ncbi:D-glycerate dehydrogenase [Ulvibacterium sp.]|uniref:2-hydroxyacid dehydrogenase n=1 Tax=Ulvibacterium sp. TaxID=2665914 RepID=UPI0026389E1C|nr:D-glycerate dehydrogenase [Ulvibacterium sp.]
MKVLVCLNIPDIGIDQMKEAGLEVVKWAKDLPMTQNTLNAEAKKYDALLTTSNYIIDSDFLRDNQHLQIISQYAVGYDNIDVEAAIHYGIPIANAPNAMTDATADIAFGLLLVVSRKMFFMHKTIAKREWQHFRPQAHLGIELKNRTLGIFGLGTIGLEFAKRCQGAYQMKVFYCNRTRNQQAENELNAKKVSFDELLLESDVISVHCALTDETKNMFNRRAFERMKTSAIFLNTARGAVHNEADLIQALKNMEIWGAGLDVTDPEPMDPLNPLLDMENVAVTPHIGSATVTARNRMSVYAAENIIALHKGEKIPYQVT